MCVLVLQSDNRWAVLGVRLRFAPRIVLGPVGDDAVRTEAGNAAQSFVSTMDGTRSSLQARTTLGRFTVEMPESALLQHPMRRMEQHLRASPVLRICGESRDPCR